MGYLKKEFIENKEDNFKQTVIFIRVENKNFLRSAAALQNIPMYVFLDNLLNEHREEYLKKVVNPTTAQQNENQPKLE